MITLENTQSDLDTQRLAIIWMRDNKENSVTVIDPEHITSFTLYGNQFKVVSRISD